MRLSNVSVYTPKNPEFEGIMYFKSEDGQDFYDNLHKFTKKYKILVDPETGWVCSVHEDVSRLYPAGFNVEEVDELPEGFDIYSRFVFKNGKILPPEVDYAAKAEQTKRELLSSAEEKVKYWIVDLQLELISEEDKASLITWRKYIKELSELDVTVKDKKGFDSIKWPTPPNR